MDIEVDELTQLAQKILDRAGTNTHVSASTIVNCLKRGGISTIQDLMSSKFDQLQSLRGVGFKKLRIIIKMRSEVKFK